MFYVIAIRDCSQPAPRMDRCLTVPENEINIDLDMVKYSDVDFR